MPRNPNGKLLAIELSEDLPAHLAAQPHQIAAVADPSISLRELAAAGSFMLDTVGRPIRVWSKDPTLAADLNERLFRAAVESRLN